MPHSKDYHGNVFSISPYEAKCKPFVLDRGLPVAIDRNIVSLIQKEGPVKEAMKHATWININLASLENCKKRHPSEEEFEHEFNKIRDTFRKHGFKEKILAFDPAVANKLCTQYKIQQYHFDYLLDLNLPLLDGTKLSKFQKILEKAKQYSLGPTDLTVLLALGSVHIQEHLNLRAAPGVMKTQVPKPTTMETAYNSLADVRSLIFFKFEASAERYVTQDRGLVALFLNVRDGHFRPYHFFKGISKEEHTLLVNAGVLEKNN